MTRAHIRTPLPPNFVKVVVGPEEVTLDVADLDDEDIDDLGRRWTIELKKRAAQRRADRKTEQIASGRDFMNKVSS